MCAGGGISLLEFQLNSRQDVDIVKVEYKHYNIKCRIGRATIRGQLIHM